MRAPIARSTLLTAWGLSALYSRTAAAQPNLSALSYLAESQMTSLRRETISQEAGTSVRDHNEPRLRQVP